MKNRIQAAFCRYGGSASPAWQHFNDLAGVVQAWQPAEILVQLKAVEESVARGLYAAGFLAYEAAPGMDEAFRTHPGGKLPLMWFGLFRQMVEQDAALDECRSDFSVGPWRGSITSEQYGVNIDRIRDYIARGHTYQVNFTFRLRAKFSGDAWSFFRRLCEAQRARYGAYLDIGPQVICSASPELFFRLDGDELSTRPMKGTCARADLARGSTATNDARRVGEGPGRKRHDRGHDAQRRGSRRRRRQRAGRLGFRRGKVPHAVPDDVQRDGFGLQRRWRRLCRLSSLPRRSPARRRSARWRLSGSWNQTHGAFIRVASAGSRQGGRPNSTWPSARSRYDRATGEAEYGVGGGIVWDSNKAGEYAECVTKAAVLTAEMPSFDLLETLLYDGDRAYFLLEGHLQRLAESAEYFDFAIDLTEVQRRLEVLGRSLPVGAHRVAPARRAQRAHHLGINAASGREFASSVETETFRPVHRRRKRVPLPQDDVPHRLRNGLRLSRRL